MIKKLKLNITTIVLFSILSISALSVKESGASSLSIAPDKSTGITTPQGIDLSQNLGSVKNISNDVVISSSFLGETQKQDTDTEGQSGQNQKQETNTADQADVNANKDQTNNSKEGDSGENNPNTNDNGDSQATQSGETGEDNSTVDQNTQSKSEGEVTEGSNTTVQQSSETNSFVDTTVTNQVSNITQFDVSSDSGESGQGKQTPNENNSDETQQRQSSPQTQPVNDDIFANFETDEPVVLDDSHLAFDELHNQIVYHDLITQKVQPGFFESTGFSWEDLRDLWPSDLDEFNEFVSEKLLEGRFKTDPIGKKRSFMIRGIDTGEFSFVTFVDLTAEPYERKEYKFFFDTAAAITSQPHTSSGDLDESNTVWFREVDENCPAVRTNPPHAPTVKKCNLYYKRTEADYSFVVDILGPEAGSSVLACLCKATLTLKNQPNIELMCSSDAVTDNAWKVLTKTQLESFDAMLKKDENGMYLMNDHRQFVLDAPEEITQMVDATAAAESDQSLQEIIQEQNPDLNISGVVVNPSDGANDVTVQNTLTATSNNTQEGTAAPEVLMQSNVTGNSNIQGVNFSNDDINKAINNLNSNPLTSA